MILGLVRHVQIKIDLGVVNGIRTDDVVKKFPLIQQGVIIHYTRSHRSFKKCFESLDNSLLAHLSNLVYNGFNYFLSKSLK